VGDVKEEKEGNLVLTHQQCSEKPTQQAIGRRGRKKGGGKERKGTGIRNRLRRIYSYGS